MMKRTRPTGPNGGTCQVIGTAETKSNSTTATELRASARRNSATPAATTAISHAKLPISSNARMRELPVKSSTSRAPVARSACRKPIDLLDENAGAEPDQDLKRGVESDEHRERDAAHQRGDASDAAQQQIHHAPKQRNEQQRPDVNDHPGRELVLDDGIELVTVAGRMEKQQHRPGNRDGDHQRNLRAAELAPRPIAAILTPRLPASIEPENR